MRTVQQGEALGRCRQPHAAPRRRLTVRARPVVADLEHESIAVPAGTHRDRAGAAYRDPPVPDGILDQRLQDHRRDHSRVGAGLDNNIHAECVAEARLHQGHVQREHEQFVAKRDLVNLARAQGGPKQFPQLFQQLVGSLRVPVQGGRDRVQRVEEEVRLQLQAQVPELRFSQRAFDLGFAEAAFVRLAVRGESVEDEDHHGKADQLDRELHEVPERHHTVVVASEAGDRIQQRARRPQEAGHRRRRDEQGGDIQGRAPAPLGTVQRKTPDQRAEGEVEQAKRQAARHLVDQRRLKRLPISFGEDREIPVREEQQPPREHRRAPQEPGPG